MAEYFQIAESFYGNFATCSSSEPIHEEYVTIKYAAHIKQYVTSSKVSVRNTGCKATLVLT